MSENKPKMCPYFPDMECPQGEQYAEACRVRMDGDFDPVAGFKDSMLMECAVRRSREKRENEEKKNL